MTRAREPSLGEALDHILTSRLRSVHTALPGTITAYDADAMTATVEVAVELEAAAGAFERVPPLADVPVVTPGAWASGDRCLLVFCEESASKWFATGSVEPPEVLVRHGLHAICVPFGAAPGQAVQFVALANLVQAQLQALADAIAGWTPVPNDGGAALKLALTALFTGPPAWPGSVAAEKLKAR
jgi:hypothetical protein